MLVMIIGKLGSLVKSVFVPYSQKALAQIAILGRQFDKPCILLDQRKIAN
jgi:hypothetical protein